VAVAPERALSVRYPLRRYRLLLVAVVGAVTVLKVGVAASTFGTDDVRRWMVFAAGVAEAGPVGVYRLQLTEFYNHPPLIGGLLEVVNAITRLGMSFPLAIRLPAILADVATPFLVFELLRARGPLRASFVAAASVAASPVLFIVSGFHGNTDSVFVLATLLSVYLLIDRRWPALAGISIAVALSVKVVPVVVVPTLVVVAVLAGRRTVTRFALGAVVPLAMIWGPAMLGAPRRVIGSVLGYQGGQVSWGTAEIGGWMGGPGSIAWLRSPGRFIVVVGIATVGAALAARRPRASVEISALALAAFLFLSPGFGVHYLAWAVAPAYLLAFRPATAYNVGASCLLFAIYTRWNGGFPWDVAASDWLTDGEAVAGLVVWVLLAWVVFAGVRRILASSTSPPIEPDDAAVARSSGAIDADRLPG
jgi:hypothetical protein